MRIHRCLLSSFHARRAEVVKEAVQHPPRPAHLFDAFTAPFYAGSAGGDDDTRVVAARARLVQAKQDGVGVEEAQAARLVALEQQKKTKDGKARGGALCWGWRGSQSISPLPLLKLPRAPL